MYLLDTNVVSELRRVRPDQNVLSWLEGVDAHSLHVSAVTIGEIQAGIERTRDQDSAKAAMLESWLEQVIASHCVLPLDGAAFRLWARLTHKKSNTISEDAMIAATARIHNLFVVTRNVADFADFDVRVINPFDAAPKSRSERA
jgi:toxin FitB